MIRDYSGQFEPSTPPNLRWRQPLDGIVQLRGPNGLFSAMTSCSGGSGLHDEEDDTEAAVFEFGDLPWVEIVYRYQGAEVARERIDLRTR